MKIKVNVGEYSGLLLSMEPVCSETIRYVGGMSDIEVISYKVSILDSSGRTVSITAAPDEITITKE